jgi:integration host factor subunit beta
MAGTRKDDGSMTKSDLVDSVSAKLQLPRGKAELIVNGVFDCMERALRSGNRIEIRGFGSFEIRHYKAYEGRNPRTGDPVGVQPKRLPFFKVGKELKERVNDGYQHELARSQPAAESPSSATNATNGTSSAALSSRL